MRALVVYESMFGNTHQVAERVAEGLRGTMDVHVVPVGEATPDALEGVDLLVVGGPTHVHGMTSETSRRGAVEQSEKDDDLHLEPHAAGPGLRDWFDGLTLPPGCRAAAFDTRIHAAAFLTGRASKGIAKRLVAHGASLVAEPESFFVGRDNRLADGEAVRAEEWGITLGGANLTVRLT